MDKWRDNPTIQTGRTSFMTSWLPKTLSLQPRTLIWSFAVIAAVMVLSALIELNQSRKELLLLMERQAHHTLESMLAASRNALLSNQYLEGALRERLLNNANFVRLLYESGRLRDPLLARLARENGLFQIHVFDRNGTVLHSSHTATGDARNSDLPSPERLLAPIFTGAIDTLFIGLKPPRTDGGIRYLLALAARDRSAIVINLDADRWLQFRKQVGFGSLIRGLGESPGIIYVALQDTSGILAASGNVTELESIQESPFLWQAWQDSSFASRVVRFNDEDVFEAVQPFYFQNHGYGIFRLGLTLEPLHAINARIYRRLVGITLVLTFIGFILFSLVLVRQHLDVVKKQYHVVETYSGNIIENVSDAIVVFSDRAGIKIFNAAAEQLFGRKRRDILHRPLTQLFDATDCTKILQSGETMQPVECRIRGQKRFLLVSKGEFTDETEQRNTVLVIRDMTEIRRLETQMQLQERLSAMGELASGVAHEIRNPLNTISTTVQQLDRDFEPKDNAEEYHQLMRLVYQEVRRINETVGQFLKFARPEPLQPEPFRLAEFFDHLRMQYQSLTEQAGITFRIHFDLDQETEVVWDRRKMQQVLMNLIQNAVDAMPEGGAIDIFAAAPYGDTIELRIRDTGPGIPESIRSKIFNLYFTTKARGTGVGLAVVQRIVYDHGGVISFETEEGQGTTFIIRLPVKAGGV